jgi:PAS domain S-box-containing protein
MNTSGIRRLLAPPVFADAHRTDVAKLVYGIALGFALIGAPCVLALALVFPDTAMRWVGLAIVAELVSLTVLAVVRWGHPTIASYVFLVGMAGYIAWSSWTAGGFAAAAIPAVVLLVFSAGMLLGWRASVVSAVLVCLSLLGLAAAQIAGMLPPAAVGESVLLHWAALSLVVAIAAVLEILSSRTVHDALDRARRELAERQATEVALRASEQTLRATLDGSPVATALVANDGRIEYMNPRAGEIFGYRAEDVPTVAAWFKLAYPDPAYRESVRHEWEGDLEAHGRDGVPMPERLRELTCADGSIRHVTVLTSVVPDRLVVAFTDLTHRVEMEDALRLSERRLHEMVDSAPFGAHSWELGPDGALVFAGANRSADEILGIDHQALIGLPIEDAFPGLVGTATPDAYRAVARGGDPWESDQFAYDDEGISGVFEVHALQVSDGRVVAFFRDVTEKRKADLALRAKTEELDRFFSLSLDLLAIVSADGRFLRVNPAWEGVLGYPAEEMEGTPYLDRVHPDDVEKTRVIAGRLAHGDVIPDFVNRYRSADGSYRWIEWRAAPFADGTSYAAARDITEWVEARDRVSRLNEELEERVILRTRELGSANDALSDANAELAAANIRLEEATHAKSRFLANMSHELRTPLNAVIGFSSILGQEMPGPLNEEQHRQVDMITGAGRHLLELINEVLDLSRIEAGRLRVELADFSCADLVADSIETVRPLADERGLRLVVSGTAADCTIHTDRMRVEQVLLNLLGNAVKFTEEGFVELRADRDGDDLVLVVSDSGVGIASTDLPRVFEEFFQARPEWEAKPAGTGLGLAVSRQIVEMLGGTISVESTLGVGSAFTVRLPVRGPDPEAEEDERQ